MVSSFRNYHWISYNNKNKIWRELSDVISPPKMPKSEKQKKHTFFLMVSSILLQHFKRIALKLKNINKGERFFMSHMPTVCSFARCSYFCFPFALETCYDLSSSSKCQGWKEAGFCTHPDHEEALIHWCPKTCYNCKYDYFRVSKTYF